MKSSHTLLEAYQQGRKLLEEGKYSDPVLDARVILCHVLGISTEFFFTHSDDLRLTSKQWEHYEELIRLRLARVPVAYIVGHKEFMGIEFEVNRTVLIPRPATEILVEKALEWLKDNNIETPLVADIGCGSGNITISLAYHNEDVKIYSVDISSKALETAQRNLSRIEIKFPDKHISMRTIMLEGDIFDPIPEFIKGKLNLIVSNPPYVTQDEWENLMDGVRLYEPMMALIPPEGVERLYGRLAKGAAEYLVTGGALMVEIGSTQKDMVKSILKREGFKNIKSYKDLEGFDRIVTGEI